MPEFPGLRSEHLQDARLFADRLDLITSLMRVPAPTVAELGVAFGDFSAPLLEKLNPRLFVAIDIFRLDELAEVWGRSTSAIFQGSSHLEYFKRQFATRGDQVVVEQGTSWEVLERYPDRFFDLIYVDAGHDYESVRRDTLVATMKLRDDGLLVYNDYVMFDHLQQGEPYGIIPNVNALVVEHDWRVVGFALQRDMFCDIALRRAGQP